MTVIRRLAPKKCPDCGAIGSLFIDDDRLLTCRLCGYKRPSEVVTQPSTSEPHQQSAEAALEERRKGYAISYRTPLTAQVERWALSKFTSAMDYARQGNYDEAITALKRATEAQRNFADAHLWLARFSGDPEAQREHYGMVISITGNNMEALRELMVLNGELSREAANRTANSDESVVIETDAAVSTQTVEIICSNCNGTLLVKAGTTQVNCQFCGHVEIIQSKAGYGMESLSMALLKERGKEIQWQVGKHLLRCDNCSAEQIITKRTLTNECPFCGSNQVIRTDALDSFRQPDGIVPFVVREAQAQEAIDKALKGVGERLKGMFNKNRVARMTLVPVYLPYWFFDVTAQVTVKVQQKGASQDAFKAGLGVATNLAGASTSMHLTPNLGAMSSEQSFTDGLSDVPYCGVDSPPRKLTQRLPSYSLKSVKPYQPKLLAGFTAEIYTVDFQRASLDVRPEIGERFRTMYGHGETSNEITRVSYIPQLMNFRLVLLPTWIATLYGTDGDIRLGLVHGQKGQVVLGKPRKSK